MGALLGITRFAARRARHRWRLLAPLLAGAVIASAILSSSSIYGDAVRQLGLDRSFEGEARHELDVDLISSFAPSRESSYRTIQSEVDLAVSRNVEWFVEGSTRSLEGSTFFVNDVGRGGAPVDASPENIVGDEQDRIDPRLRAFFFYQTLFDEHVSLVEGGWPETVGVEVDADEKPIGFPEIPVVVLERTAQRQGLSVGDRLMAVPYWEDVTVYAVARITGVVRPVDAEARFWRRDLQRYVESTREDNFIAMYVPEETFFRGVGRLFPSMKSDYAWGLFVDPARIDADSAGLARFGLDRTDDHLRARLASYRSVTGLDGALANFETRDLFGRIPLSMLLVMMLGVVLYYLVMASNVVVERNAEEVALLRSRGADGGQVFLLYLSEAGLIAVAAFFAGPPIAFAVTGLMGFTPAFSAFNEGVLPVSLTPAAYGLSLGGAALALAAMLLPAVGSAGLNPLTHHTELSRPRGAPFFTRYYLDIFLGLIAGLLFWELASRGTVVTEALFAGEAVDEVLLAAPALFMLAAALLLLRFFPMMTAVLGWAVSRLRSAAAPLALWRMSREPAPFTRPLLLLLLAGAVAMFAINFGATLDRNYADRALYASGGDVLFQGADLSRDGPSTAFEEEFGGIGEAATPAFRTTARPLLGLFSRGRFNVLGVDPDTFGDVAWWRDDFAGEPLGLLMSTLREDAPTGGLLLPADASGFGVWLMAETPRRDVMLRARVRDANGRHVDYDMGRLVAGEWQLYEAALTSAGLGRARSVVPEPPVTLLSLAIEQSGGAGLEPGALYLDEVHAVTPGGRVRVEEFGAAAGVAVIEDALIAVADALHLEAGPARLAGEGPTAAFTWGTTGLGSTHGVSFGETRSASAPMPALASKTALEQEGLEHGDRIALSIASHRIPIEIVETAEFFPTLDPFEQGFLVLDLDGLLRRLNRADRARDWQPNEVWVRTGLDGPERERFIAGIEQSMGLGAIDRDAIEGDLQADPLTAAGWKGILFISLAAVLFASLLGVGVYGYVQAQRRRVEFALLRGIGLSTGGLATIVLIEQTLMLVIGLGLGGVIGYYLIGVMMPFLGLTEEGARVLPPFSAEMNPVALAITYGAMAVGFLAAGAGMILALIRFGMHRALRLGEVG